MTTKKQKTIKQHEDEYIHIPKVKILPLLGTIITGLLAYFNFYLFDWNTLRIIFGDNEELIKTLTYSALSQIWIALGEYLLISLFLISLVAIFKRGYNNLKDFDEAGLIGGLILGLILGLIFGLILGLIFGLIFGLIGGLILGLIGGLIAELGEEFD